MTTLNERLKKIRAKKHLTQSALGEIVGVSKQAIANIESCHSNPSINFIGKLIENLNVNSNWFITGKGNMFNSPKFEDVEDEFTQKVEAILRKHNIVL